MSLHIIIVGPPASGKTTLLHKIMRDNVNGMFSCVIDGVEQIINNLVLPNNVNWILTCSSLNNVPSHLRDRALVLNVQNIRT